MKKLLTFGDISGAVNEVAKYWCMILTADSRKRLFIA